MGVVPRRSSGFVFALVCLLVIGETWIIIGGSASASIDGTYYFAGTASDQAEKDSCTLAAIGTPGASCTPPTFTKEAPDSSSTVQQSTTPNCGYTIPYDPFCAYWVGEYKGAIDGNVEICWSWSSTNAAHVAAGTIPVEVAFFIDPVNDISDQSTKVIGQAEIEIEVGTPDSPVQNVSIIPVKGKPTAELMIQAGVIGGDADQGAIVHYGSTEHPSGFGRPGTVCPGGTPTQTSTATSPPSQTTNATPPGVQLRVSDSTPERGTIVKAKGSLRKCAGHKGTKLQLQKKKAGKFRKVAVKKLNKRCRATFPIRATFKRATFRAFWPKQDRDHRAGRSKPRTIRTHR